MLAQILKLNKTEQKLYFFLLKSPVAMYERLAHPCRKASRKPQGTTLREVL